MGPIPNALPVLLRSRPSRRPRPSQRARRGARSRAGAAAVQLGCGGQVRWRRRRRWWQRRRLRRCRRHLNLDDIAACAGQDEFPDGLVLPHVKKGRGRPRVKRIQGYRDRAQLTRFNISVGLDPDDEQWRCSCCKYPGHTARNCKWRAAFTSHEDEDGLLGYKGQLITRCVLVQHLLVLSAADDFRSLSEKNCHRGMDAQRLACDVCGF